MILIGAVLALCIYTNFPIVLDIAQKSIVTVNNVKYLRDPTDFSITDYIGQYSNYIIVYFPNEGGGQVSQILNDPKDYPYGEHYGTVVYAKHSHLVIDFIFNET